MAGFPAQALVLAAGEAKRLRPLTERRAKGMLLVGGQPILHHLAATLEEIGVQRLVLVVGHAAEGVQAFFKDGKDFGLRVEYAHQTQPTGTADAARLGLALLDAKHPCLILPGDNYLTRATLAAMAKGADDLLLLASPRHETRYGIPTLKGDRLVSLKDGPVTPGSARVSTGVLRASARFLGRLASSEEHDLDRVVHAYVEAGGTVRVAEAAGPWEDVTDPWDVLQLNEHILGLAAQAPKGKKTTGAAAVVGKTSRIAPTATLVPPVAIGEGCTVGDYTVVGPYVSVRNNTTIGSHCEVRRSILNNNVFVDSRCLVRGSILDDGVRLGSGFASQEAMTPKGLVGCVLGADCEVGPDARAESGAVVQSEAKVAAGGRISAER